MARRADRPAGTRSRAGNAMARTQAAIVGGVGQCLLAHGVRRTTMIDIAAAAGVAKATLYNHVRTKQEALGLYADAEVDRLIDLLQGPPEAALLAAADAVAGHQVLHRLVTEPPAVAAVLVGAAAAQRRARVGEALEDLLGVEVAPLAGRWLVSLLVDAGTAAAREADVRVLAELARAFRATAAADAGGADQVG